METTVQDLPELLKGIPDGSWVVVSTSINKVIAYGEDVTALVETAHRQGVSEPLILRAPLFVGKLAL